MHEEWIDFSHITMTIENPEAFDGWVEPYG